MSCVGNPCSRVSYAFKSFDGNLTYVYTPRRGRPSSGALTPGGANDNYVRLWLSSFIFWLAPGFGFFLLPSASPFQTTEPDCEEGCECDLGPEVVKDKQYTYSPAAFTLTNGATIQISGKFTMTVTSQAGVCTLKAGSEFSMSEGEGEELLATLSGLGEDLGPPECTTIEEEKV